VKNFTLLKSGIDIRPLRDQLERSPELWNANPQRRSGVHAEMTDIWVRYRPLGELMEPKNYREPHWGEFYPAWYALPALKPIVFDLMRLVEATHLGAILITRIPPGGQILPHDDRGSWHAEFHNCKIYLPIVNNPDCWNQCEHDRVHMRPGEAWTFDNLRVHSVHNDGDTERVTLILCCRTEGDLP